MLGVLWMFSFNFDFSKLLASKDEVRSTTGKPTNSIKPPDSVLNVKKQSIQDGIERFPASVKYGSIFGKVGDWRAEGADIDSGITHLLQRNQREDLSFAKWYINLCARLGAYEKNKSSKRTAETFEGDFFFVGNGMESTTPNKTKRAPALYQEYRHRCGAAIDYEFSAPLLSAAMRATKPGDAIVFQANRVTLSNTYLDKPITNEQLQALEAVHADTQLWAEWLIANPSVMYRLIDFKSMRGEDMNLGGLQTAAFLAACELAADCTSQGRAFLTMCFYYFSCDGDSIQEGIALTKTPKSAAKIRAVADEMIAKMKAQGLGAFGFRSKLP